ncbi:hypothetical protein [Nocardioides sp. R-C-SC26]|uniref:hypothetical protein n=1 Tax=Nocardioides sp. R-C-SC26 TaxID=2870414 RepID=UPI001E3F2887|nr:hypothetical protein [Nocardioides sp. R-C-SC26]
MTQEPSGYQPYVPPGSSYPPYGYGGYGPPPRPPEHPRAVTSLTLGIVSLAGGLTCYLPLLLGPYAWYLGVKVRREIAAQPHLGGRDRATAGMICGIVASAFLALALAFLALIIVLALNGELDDEDDDNDGSGLFAVAAAAL